jgi:hypothetical protein
MPTTKTSSETMNLHAPNKRRLLNYLITSAVISLFALTAFAECFEMSAYWKLEEETPPYIDAINPTGTYSGTCIDETSCPTPIPGIFGTAMKFYMNADSTSGSGINIAASPQGDTLFDWAARDSFSIEFWMKRGEIDLLGHEVILGRDNYETGQPDEPENIHWWIGVEAPGGEAYVRFDARPIGVRETESNRYIRGKNNKFLFSNTVVNDGTWHHIVAVRDANQFENRLYVDGVLEAKTTVIYKDSEGFNAFASKTADLTIGYMKRSHHYHYQGLLDELAIYDEALPTWYIEQRFYSGERTDPCE